MGSIRAKSAVCRRAVSSLLVVLSNFWLLHATRLSCLAQEYEEYYGEYFEEAVKGPTTIQKLLTSPAASLVIVLIGSAGLFNLFFTSEKGGRSERQSFIGLVCVGLVIAMCWYRFSLWNDPNFNAKPH